MILPLGDEPNPPGVPVVTYALILVNCAVFFLLTLPLGFVRPDRGEAKIYKFLTILLYFVCISMQQNGY